MSEPKDDIMPARKRERKRYEAPKVMDFGSLARGRGDRCRNGSGPSGECRSGNGPTGECRDGYSPTGTCRGGFIR